jgi:hypothetical protein
MKIRWRSSTSPMRIMEMPWSRVRLLHDPLSARCQRGCEENRVRTAQAADHAGCVALALL